MTTVGAPVAHARGGAIGDALAIVRYHIVFVAIAGALVFGWLMTGRYLFWLLPIIAADWFFINLLNRVTDIDEDLKNGIRGTERVALRARALAIGCFALMGASFVVTHALLPALTPWRAAVQLIGLGYNCEIVPTGKGFSRFKEIYFLKNFGSSVLFVLTCFVYPLVVATRTMGWGGVAALALFFVPFELTFEILYDLRDLEGDRVLGVPTYPVVHGPERARQIIDGLLVLSAMSLSIGLFSRAIGVREGLMLAAPVVQLVFYRPRYRRGLTSADCIGLTHLATGLILFYLAGNGVWLRVGMPANIYL